MLVTALTKHPKIGYDLAAKIAKQAHSEGKTIRQILLQENILDPEEIDKGLDLSSMVLLDRSSEE